MNKLKTNTLYILSGIPSVGKSTFIENLKTNFELPNNCVISTDELRKQIIAKKSEAEIRASWKKDLKQFEEIRNRYIIYND